MAERWQRWMPFHIDRFRGSPDVQAMPPAARWGYLSLLASAWQTDDCTISSDPLDLASVSSLGDELWAIHGPRILRKFPTNSDGRLQNDVCFGEWLEAKRIFDARAAAARRTTEIRSPREKSTVTVQSPSRSARKSERPAHTQTSTITNTSTETEVQKTLASTANAVPAGKLLGTLPLNDGSEWQVWSAFADELQPLYPAVDVVQELRAMKGWLIGNPANRKTKQGIKRFITSWLAKEQNKAKPANGGTNGRYKTKSESTVDALKRSIENSHAEGAAGKAGSSPAGADRGSGVRHLC